MADMNFGVNILPDVDSSKNLGSSTKKWNTLYTNTLNEKPILNFDNAGFHNCIYRGKNLGDHVTEAQWAAIQNGTFEDLFIGDYWLNNGIIWRIAAFNYWIGKGDTACTTNHIVIVPDYVIASASMYNDFYNSGGYVGSDFYQGTNGNTGKTNARNVILTMFGEHILVHREQLSNAVTNGEASGWAWYDSELELMNEPMLYGTTVWTRQGFDVGCDCIQLPLFAMNPGYLLSNTTYVLRTTYGSQFFSSQGIGGACGLTYAATVEGIRPVFGLKA